MNKQDAETVFYSQDTPEACDREIADYEAHCELQCDFIAPACMDCNVPLIISILKMRKEELIKQGA